MNKITLAGLLTVHLPLLAVVVVLGRLLAPMQTAGTHIADYLAHRQLPPLTPARDDEAGRFSSSANGSC